jgi:hypothetical protein
VGSSAVTRCAVLVYVRAAYIMSVSVDAIAVQCAKRRSFTATSSVLRQNVVFHRPGCVFPQSVNVCGRGNGGCIL